MKHQRTPLARLLADLDRAGLSLAVKGDRLAISPAARLTPELKAEVLRFRDDLVEAVQAHGPDLLSLFREPETEGSVSWRLSPDGPGWAAVRSHVLGEAILFLRDEAVALPPEAAGLLTYTWAELEILATATEDALREIHRAKKLFGGRVTSLNTLSQEEPGRLTA